jgi:hypothetical protein
MNTYLLIVCSLFPFAISAQSILGKVTDEKNRSLPGASIYWLGTNIGVSAGDKGEFELSSSNISDKRLVASFVGYEPDTVQISDQTFVEFQLQATGLLDEVTVQSERPGVIISDVRAVKTEQITQTELRKAACCDLAGCFETQTTVQPQTTNVVTNSK